MKILKWKSFNENIEGYNKIDMLYGIIFTEIPYNILILLNQLFEN
jgi:hypothetical protein